MDEQTTLLIKNKAIQVSSYIGSAVSVLSSLTLADVGVIVGVLTAVATFVVNAVYTYRKDQREKRESRARLHEIEASHE